MRSKFSLSWDLCVEAAWLGESGHSANRNYASFPDLQQKILGLANRSLSGRRWTQNVTFAPPRFRGYRWNFF
jgi:hypothetical protein